MKTLSIRQPWVHAILHLGKRCENRDWKHAPSYRGPILIHASAWKVRRSIALDMESIRLGLAREGIVWTPPSIDSLQYGGIVATARLSEVLPRGDVDRLSDWGVDFWRDEDELGFVMEGIEPLPFYPCAGKLGFFDVDLSKPPRVAIDPQEKLGL